MKLNLKKIVFLSLISIGLLACDKEKTPIELNTSPAQVKQLAVYPGHNRVKISFSMSDEAIEYCDIYWNKRKNSKRFKKSEAIAGTITTYIEDLAEGEYVIEVLAFDKEDKPSIVALNAVAKVYGDKYAAPLMSRKVSDLVFLTGKEPYINWGSPAADEVAIKVKYTDEAGEDRSTSINRSIFVSSLPGYKPNTPITYQSLYLPEKKAIDTFYTAAVTVAAPTYYASFATKLIVEKSDLVVKVLSQSSTSIHGDVEYSTLKFENDKGQPLTLSILRADLKNEKVTLSALMPNDGTIFGLQGVKEMAEHRQNAGTKVLGAVNADFFEWTGVPWGPVFIDGKAIRSVSKDAGLSYFAIQKNGSPQIGLFSQLPTNELANIRDMVGGGAHRLMVNGVRQIYNDTALEPRTMVGYTANKEVYLIVVDGRNANHSIGITIDGLSAIMNSLGATYGLNLDGGGSSTMVINRNNQFNIVNKFSDANPRAVANALAIVALQ